MSGYLAENYRRLFGPLTTPFEKIMKEEKEEKRYVATMEFYVWAKNDEEAKQFAANIAKEQDQKYDDRAEITDLVKQPFGTFGNRKV